MRRGERAMGSGTWKGDQLPEIERVRIGPEIRLESKVLVRILELVGRRSSVVGKLVVLVRRQWLDMEAISQQPFRM